MNKKILYGLILLLTLSLTLGAVSANDDFSNETLGVSLSAPVNDIELSTNNEEASAKNSDALLGSSNENALGAGEGTFTELQTLVSRGGTITLDKDYIFTGGSTNGITITSAGTVLDGNGHTIDGKGLSRIFTISGNSVTLKNLNIINGYHTTTAGAASISGSNVIIDNCTFANSSSTGRFGGAVSWSGPNGILRNSNFISNHAYTRGGAIHWLGDKGTLQNLLIINNTADNVAGGLYISDESPQRTSTVGYNLTFIGNTAYSGGGAVIAGKNSKISYSTFKNNHAYYGGGAIIEEDLGGTTIIDNCIIVNNTANNYGGGANINFGTISNSIVENNTAYVGGGIYGVKGTVKNVTSINNFAVYGINMAVVSQLTIIASYITETYYFNLTESYSSTTGSNTIITLPNGDYAYCIEKFSSPPAYGYFNPAVDMVKNTATGENVGEYIKILIYENVENKNSALAKSLYEQIWIFVDSDFRSSTDPLVKRAVELYDSGFRVPTKNAIKVLSDGTELVYNFYTIISACARQNLFYFTIDNHGKVNINPELSVQKITLNKTVYSGEQTSFEIFVKNTGNVDLNTVTVTENSYDGLEYDSFKGDLWTHSIVNGKHVYRFNHVLKIGMNASFIVTFNTNRTGNFTNVVVAKSDKTTDKPADNTTEVILNKTNPSMDVNKVSLTPVVNVGEQTLFLITVWNTGELDLGNVFVEEQIPDGLTYAGFVGDKWTKNGNVFYYNDVLGVGESANFTIVFNTHVNGTFVNCVVAGSNETENKTTNNTTVVKKPGMIVDKKSLTPNVKVGEQTLFLITVKNTGELDLGNVFVEEQIPDGLTYAGFVGDKWTKNGNVFYYNGILGIGESANFTIAFNTSMEGKFINCVVAGSNETENKTTNNTTKVVEPKFEVQKITITPTVLVGEQVTFEIVVRNTGEVDLTNVFIDEYFPSELIYDSYVSRGYWTQSIINGIYRWTLIGNLTPNEVMGILITFNTTQKGNFTNVVVVGSDETENKTTNNTTEVVDGKFDVQKITINPVVLVGEQVTFEIVVRNTGTVALNDVFVKELSYEGLTYASFNDNGLWTYNGQGLWILNRALEVNEVVSLFVTFNTTQRGNFTNVVVAGSDETENKTTNNTTTVLEPKLDVQKITITPTVLVGEQVSFEIVVRNTGDVALNDVFVRELSYDGLTYTSFDDNGLWTYNGQNLWTLNKVLAVNEVETLIVTFNTTQKGNFTNVVVAGSDKTENKTTNNTTTVVEGKLDVRKITINPIVLVGDQVTFEIVVKNIGEAALTNVFVEESSYDGLTYASYINNGDWTHSFINGKHRWTLNTNLAVNEVVGLFVVFNTTQKGNFTNVVVAGSDKTENKTTNNTTKVVEPKLDVQKITLTPVVHVGNQTSFEIVVRNTGEVALHNVVLEETSYEGLTYASFVQDNNLWSHSVVNGKNIWTLNKVLNVKEIVSLIVNFDTTEVGNFTNIVTVGSTETEDKIANNTTTVYNKTTPVPESNTTKNPNINIEKTALNDVVIVGEQVIFEIIVTNTGEVVLHDVTVTEDSFDGLQYLSFFDNTGLWNNNALTWTLNTPLYVGEMASFYVVFNTTASGKFINIVSVDSNETDKKSANDTVEAIKPEMDVQKVTINKSVLVGDQVTFEIIVENTGKVTLNNVVVRESSYDGLVYNSFIDHTGLWTKNGDDLSWKLNTPLYAGEYAGFFVVFNTTKTGKFVNVIVAGSDETPNKTDNDTVDVFEGNIDVQKITLTPIVPVGNQTSFEIIVQNIGEIPLHNVVLEETSYDGLIYDSFVNNGLWTHSVVNGKNIWTLNRVLNVNEMVTLIVNFNTVTVGNFTNIVTVFSNETGNKVANNTTIVYNNTKPTPEQDPSNNPNINIEKIALHKVVILGNQAIFEIIVTNTGDTVLHDVTVSEDSFTGLTYADWYDNTGLWTKNRDLTWTMNSPLYVGEIASFYVVFDTTTTGEFTNIVSVDSNETDKKSANDTVEVIKPDFAVEKITINRSVLVGEQVMFEILVHNLGQVDLNNVVVRETSYAGLIYDSFIDSAALWTKNSDLSWRLNNPLRVGEYAGFFVVFNTTTTGNFINVVVADSTEIPNKTSNDTVEVLQPNFEVQKITINRTVYVGEKVMFEIVVHNAGKVVLNDVTIRENSFDGLIYDSFIDNYNLWTKNNDLSWTLNTPLYAGEYLSFYVVFNTNKVGTFTNVVSASSDKTQDKFANNITTVIDRPVPDENKTYTPMADLAIVKVVYAIDGNKVTWGLYVVNNGPDKAVNARVMDVLPETLQYINSFTSKGSYDVNSGVWLIGDMENGEEAVMIIETIALTTGEITNEAIVTSDTIDPNLRNNYDNETVVISVPETPQQPAKANVEPVDVTPATGNPLVMVLLALFVVAAGTLRRKK